MAHGEQSDLLSHSSRHFKPGMHSFTVNFNNYNTVSLHKDTADMASFFLSEPD